MAKVHIGTSGWHYKHWCGPFYAEKLPGPKMLQCYVQYFDTAEINNSFYKLPEKSAFEFREHSWERPEVYEILRRHNAAMCIFELAGYHSPLEITADFTYVRLHGPGGAYQGSYSHAQLRRWAKQIEEWSQLRNIYVY